MKTKRHDAIRNYLAKFLSASGLKVDMEMPLGSSDNKRMDLVLKESNGAGGAMSTLTTEHFKQWRRITPNWDHLQRLISFALVRKRVTNFRLI